MTGSLRINILDETEADADVHVFDVERAFAAHSDMLQRSVNGRRGIRRGEGDYHQSHFVKVFPEFHFGRVRA